MFKHQSSTDGMQGRTAFSEAIFSHQSADGSVRCFDRKPLKCGVQRILRETRMSLASFHLAFPVDVLNDARAFYCGVLGCSEGRSDKEWVDFNFYGHQIVAYQVPGEARKRITSPVDR